MGVTLASFQEDGKYPSERERLKMTAYGCAKMCEPSFNRRGLIRSGPLLVMLCLHVVTKCSVDSAEPRPLC